MSAGRCRFARPSRLSVGWEVEPPRSEHEYLARMAHLIPEVMEWIEPQTFSQSVDRVDALFPLALHERGDNPVAGWPNGPMAG